MRVFELLRIVIDDLINLKLTGAGIQLRNRDWQGQLQQSSKLLDLQALFQAHDKLIEFNRLAGGSSGIRELDLLTDFAVFWADAVCGGERETA